MGILEVPSNRRKNKPWPNIHRAISKSLGFQPTAGGHEAKTQCGRRPSGRPPHQRSRGCGRNGTRGHSADLGTAANKNFGHRPHFELGEPPARRKRKGLFLLVQRRGQNNQRIERGPQRRPAGRRRPPRSTSSSRTGRAATSQLVSKSNERRARCVADKALRDGLSEAKANK